LKLGFREPSSQPIAWNILTGSPVRRGRSLWTELFMTPTENPASNLADRGSTHGWKG
jgi:hypothetical protein